MPATTRTLLNCCQRFPLRAFASDDLSNPVSNLSPHTSSHHICHAMSHEGSNHLAPGQQTWRLILVQRPMGESFQNIANAIPWSKASIGPTKSTIDWDDNDTSTLPTMESNLYFVRHIALCVIPKDTWEDATLSRREKFRHGLFWEHPGASSGKPAQLRDGLPWEIEHIEHIDAIQDLGETNRSITKHREFRPRPIFCCKDSSYTNLVYYNLFDGWPYDALWWNCHDFAIRLAYLIVGDEALHILRSILKALRYQVQSEMSFKKDQSAVKWTFGLGYTGAILMTIPPLAPVGSIILGLGLLSWGIGTVSRSRDRNSKWTSRSNMAAIEAKFPQLIQLHEPIAESWRYIYISKE
jgi:hypothetical protein